jgi:hypothetical protein
VKNTIFLCILLYSLPVFGQDGGFDLEVTSETELVETAKVIVRKPPARFPTVQRGFHWPLATVADGGTLQLHIDHRTFSPMTKDPFHDLLGLDGGNLKIGFVFDFSALDWLAFRIGRQNGTIESYDTFEFTTRIQALEADRHFLNLTVGAALDWFVEPKLDDRLGAAGYLTLGRDLPGGLGLNATTLLASRSSSLTRASGDTEWSLAVGGELSWTMPWFQALRIAAEFATPVAGYRASDLTWTGGITYYSYRHGFSLVVGNNQMLTLDGLAAGTSRQPDDVIFGFTILRQWELFE